MFCSMAKAKRNSKKFLATDRRGRYVSRPKAGKLAHVTIARPRIGPDDVDLDAVRRAFRAYFRTHPQALE
jgi:hypothetical protein